MCIEATVRLRNRFEGKNVQRCEEAMENVFEGGTDRCW